MSVENKVSLISVVLYYELLTSKALRYGTCKLGIPQFYLTATQ